MSEKILIVDDDIESLKLIGLMLQRQGYEVIAANAGLPALAKAGSELPDLIILDVMMPDMNGYEVCKRLRGNPDTRTIPIIMFTAKTLIDDKVAGFEAGADDYLTKPTHPAELSSRIKSVLARNPGRPKRDQNQGRAIAVIGAKGGIGTTTVALNMAASLIQPDMRPIVADFRLGDGSMAQLLGEYDHCGMANILSRPSGDVQAASIEKELIQHPSGLRALMSSMRPKEAQLQFSLDTAQAVVRGLRDLGTPVVFDLGMGYSRLNERLMGQMNQIVLLVEPIGNTLRMAEVLLSQISEELMKPVSVVVVNRMQSRAQIPWQEVESMLGQEVLSIVSSAPELAAQAAEAHMPIVLHQPSSIVASQLTKLADEVFAK